MDRDGDGIMVDADTGIPAVVLSDTGAASDNIVRVPIRRRFDERVLELIEYDEPAVWSVT